MDIQKEREAFECWFRTTATYKTLWDFISTHQTNIKSVFVKRNGKTYQNDCVQIAWEAWQAKAQAIPDGYVLMPKEPNREFKDRLRSYLDNLWMGDHGCDWDYFVDAKAIKPNEIWQFMIEAQEPANEAK
ncbi:hypothetical protein [Acinetobacter indicus]|uniref:hypothetical protein n=1 Tax=Acinetobacter indicus TaxID=756892 RepID=UPI000948F400|nr:hypothetical protein [Acinetobacter indicus]